MEAPVPFSVYVIFQEGQTVVADILCEFDVTVHLIDAFCEGLHFLDFNFDPCVVHVSVPIARCCSTEEIQGFLLFLRCWP